MNTISPEQLLAQMRTLRAEMPAVATPPDVNAAAGGFGASLAQALDGVNEAQNVSKTLKAEYAAESGDASLTDVMIAAQKADLSFRAMTEVRNKLVNAYQEIMNMPV